MNPRHRKGESVADDQLQRRIAEADATHARLVAAIEQGRKAGRIADENANALIANARAHHQAATALLRDRYVARSASLGGPHNPPQETHMGTDLVPNHKPSAYLCWWGRR